MHDKLQGTKERHKVRKKLFGEKEGEKMDMIDDDEDGETDKIEWDSGDNKEEPEARNGIKMTKAAKKGMRENPLYRDDNRGTEEENTDKCLAAAWNEVDSEADEEKRDGEKEVTKSLEKEQLRKISS